MVRRGAVRTKRDIAKDRAAMALATGASVSEAADAAGVSRNTVPRWIDDGLGERVEEIRAEVQRTAIDVLRTAALAAAEDLARCVGEKNVGDRVRVATAILDRVGVGPGASLSVETRSRYDGMSLSELRAELKREMDALAAELEEMGGDDV